MTRDPNLPKESLAVSHFGWQENTDIFFYNDNMQFNSKGTPGIVIVIYLVIIQKI